MLTRAEDLIEETFQPVPHRHLVVSLPKALRKAFLYNRDLLQKLPGLAWRAYLSVLQEVSGQPEARAGGVLCNHTFSTSDLTWHPHVHGIVMAGVFTGDGRFLRCTREDLAEKAQERFEQAVLDLLGQEVPQLEGTLERMQTWEHSGFDLYLGKVLEAHNKPATQNLTEYILRPSFSLGALEVDEQEGKFVYRAKGAKKACDPLGPLELLARISTHIPDKYKHTIFRYGLYSNAAVGRARREEQAAGRGPTPEEEAERDERRRTRRSWAVLLARVWDIDALECPACGQKMRIIAFVTDPREVDHIVRHCNLDVAYRAPPACAGLIPAAEIEPYDPDEQQLLPWEDLEVLDDLAAAESDEYLD